MANSILIVDDSFETRLMLRMLLELSGFEIQEAENGEDALEKLNQNLPDLVLLDVMMPIMDGITACKKLRQNARFAQLPVIMLSGKVHGDAAQIGLEAGATAYLAKPINSEQLLKQINLLIEADGA